MKSKTRLMESQKSVETPEGVPGGISERILEEYQKINNLGIILEIQNLKNCRNWTWKLLRKESISKFQKQFLDEFREDGLVKTQNLFRFLV